MGRIIATSINSIICSRGCSFYIVGFEKYNNFATSEAILTKLISIDSTKLGFHDENRNYSVP